MANFKEINEYAKEKLGTDFPRATLTRWVQTGIIKAVKTSNGRFDYDLKSFKQAINNKEYLKKSKAAKQIPKDYIGKICGKLLITGIVPREEYKEKNYVGTLMYCDCLNCGKKHIQVRFSYLSGNGNYTQKTCGCNRKIRAFQASTRQDLTDDFLNSFDDFEKFLLLHKSLSRTTDIDILNIPLQEYQNIIQYFYNDKQFNAVYSFWKNENYQENTFYDWAKPSIDHIIPKSKGGTDDINNLQFLTVFENLSKRDMTQSEWNNFKEKTHTKSDYFIESIMKGGKDIV